MLIYMKKPLIFSLFALLTVGLAPAAIAAAASAQLLPVVIVQRHLVDLAFPAESLVEAVQQTTVGAQVAGRVLEVRVDAGQVVKKGELLMRIDAREAAEVARAAAAQYANAKVSYERTKSAGRSEIHERRPRSTRRRPISMPPPLIARRLAPARATPAIVAPMTGIVARRHAELGDMAMHRRAPVHDLPAGQPARHGQHSAISAEGNARRDDGARRVPRTRQVGRCTSRSSLLPTADATPPMSRRCASRL
jgi:biotin carboxyl carrier protein